MLHEDDEYETVECPFCCFCVHSQDIMNAEAKVDAHIREEHPFQQ